MYSSGTNKHTHKSNLLSYLKIGKNSFSKSKTYKDLPSEKELIDSISGSHKGAGKNVDYLLNKAIDKKKYLGIFDPTSPNNKDIFIDSDSEANSPKRNPNHTKLVIAKSISQYPKNIKDFGKFLQESSSSYVNVLRSLKNNNIENNNNNNNLFYDNNNQRYFDNNIYEDPSMSFNNDPSYTFNKPTIKFQNFNNHTFAPNNSIRYSQLSPNILFTPEEKIMSPINDENIYDSRRKIKLQKYRISGIPLNINGYNNKNYNSKNQNENFYKTNESNFYQTLKNQRKLIASNNYNLFLKNNRKNMLQRPFSKNNSYLNRDYSNKKNYNYYDLINQAASKIQAIWRGGQIREFMSFFYNINKLKYILMNIIHDRLSDYFNDFITKLSQKKKKKQKYTKVKIPNKDQKTTTKIYTTKTNTISNEKNRDIEKYKSLLNEKEKDLENLSKDYNDISKKYEELLLNNNSENKKSHVLSISTCVDNNIISHRNNSSCFSIFPEKKEFNENKTTEMENDSFYILGNIKLDKEENKDDKEEGIKLRKKRKKEKKTEEKIEKGKKENKFNYEEFAKYFISNLQTEKSNEITLINNTIEKINKFFDTCLLQKCLCNELDINIAPKKLFFDENKLFELPQSGLNIEIIGTQKVNENAEKQEEEKKEKTILVFDNQFNNISIIQNEKNKEFNKENLIKETSSFLYIYPNNILSNNSNSNNPSNNNCSNKYLEDKTIEFSFNHSEKLNKNNEIEKQKQENIISKISEICILNKGNKIIDNKDNKEDSKINLRIDSKKLDLNIVSKSSELSILNNNNNEDNKFDTDAVNIKKENKEDKINDSIKNNNNLAFECQKSEFYIPSSNNSKNSKKATEYLEPKNTESILLTYNNKYYNPESLSILNNIISIKLKPEKKLKVDKETEITTEFYIFQPSNHYDLIYEGLLRNNILTQNINTGNKKFNDEEIEEVNQDDMEINPLEFKRTNTANIIINHQNKLEILCNKDMQLNEKVKQNVIKIILPIRLKSNLRKCVSRFVIKSLKKDNK